MESSGKSKNKISYGDVEIDEDILNPKNQKIRITAMVDGDILAALKARAKENGGKYQTILNQVLRDAILGKPEKSFEKRLSRLEKLVHSKIGKKDA